MQNSNYAKNSFSFDLGPKNPQNLSSHKRYISKIVLRGSSTKSKAAYNPLASHVHGEISSIHFSITHAKCPHLKYAPKMESSSPSIGVVLTMPSKFGFKNRKVTTNKGNRVL
jgi:hypothetical protein